MTNSTTIPASQGPIVTDFVLVDLVMHDEILDLDSVAPQGHTLHIPLQGEASQLMHGGNCTIKRGHVVWHHEHEPVLGKVTKAPCWLLNINFIAPSLAPPEAHRVRAISEEDILLAGQIFRLWRQSGNPSTERRLRLHIQLAQLILNLLAKEPCESYEDTEIGIWWRIEKHVRSHLAKPMGLKDLEEVASQKRHVINRACRAATQTTPMQRVKQIRLDHAHNLVQLSHKPIDDVAADVGYAKVTEFCRDYQKQFGVAPEEDR